MQKKRFLTLALGLIGSLALISLYSCNKNNTSPNTPPVVTNTDIDGNHYDTVRIGKQLWMVQPLRVTRFNDGTAIPYRSKGSDWALTGTNPARCYYGANTGVADVSNSDSDTYAPTYAALYNWHAVNHKGADGKPNLAPKGWHIADTTEWNTLIGTLNGNPNFRGSYDRTVGGMLKDTGITHWSTPNTGATNSSRFKALPAGYRYDGGFFDNLGKYAYFWSSTELTSTVAYYQYLSFNNAGINRGVDSKLLGISVVCVRD